MQSACSLKFGPAFKWMLLAGVVSTLAACGGGSDYTPPVTPPAPPPDKTLAISGTAATGAPIIGAPVSAACKSGSGTATTAADGSYTVTVRNQAEGPCVLSVTQGTLTLRSLATGDGAKANITPLTDMLVTYIAVQSGAGAAVSSAALAANTNFKTVVGSPTVLAASVTQVISVIQAAAGAGAVVPTDFLSAVLVPKSTTNPGNVQDQILELLRARNVITTTGAVATQVVGAVTVDAAKHTVTGATGGT